MYSSVIGYDHTVLIFFIMCLITSTLDDYVLTSILVGGGDGGDVTGETDSKPLTQYETEF